jgi:hypothetical protein
VNKQPGDLKSLIFIGSMGTVPPLTSVIHLEAFILTSVLAGNTPWRNVQCLQTRGAGNDEIHPPSHGRKRYPGGMYSSFFCWSITIFFYGHNESLTLSLFSSDTGIVPVPVKVFLAGIPKPPVSRIAGAIFYAATDRDEKSSGSAWLLVDDGPVFLVPKEQFKQGVYKMIDERANAVRAYVISAVNFPILMTLPCN